MLILELLYLDLMGFGLFSCLLLASCEVSETSFEVSVVLAPEDHRAPITLKMGDLLL